MELTGNVRNEDPDEDWIYMERHHNNEINSEIWNLNDEDLNLDFNEVQESRFPTPYHDVRDEKSTIAYHQVGYGFPVHMVLILQYFR